VKSLKNKNEQLIDCKNCKRTCCDNQDIYLKKKIKEIDPHELKVGSWLYVKGIIWKKKKNGLWKCIAFDSKKRTCKIWKYRPPLCRYYFCQFAKKKKRKNIANHEDYKELNINSKYRLIFHANLEGLKKGILQKK